MMNIGRFVKNNDYSYDERRREWSFLREKAEGDNNGVISDRPGEEIWRCLWVGRYKVERVKSKNSASKFCQRDGNGANFFNDFSLSIQLTQISLLKCD